MLLAFVNSKRGKVEIQYD